MNSLTFTVPGKPTAKARARVTRYGTYTPDSTQAAEMRVLEHYLAAYSSRPPLTGPVALTIVATFDVPKSWSRVKREAAYGKPHTSRPDSDNIAKLVTDALNGTLYADDAQVYSLGVVKRYVVPGESAGVKITVRWST